MRTVAVTLGLGLTVLVAGTCGNKKPTDTIPLQTIATETTTTPTLATTTTTLPAIDIAYIQNIMNQIDHLEGEQFRLLKRLGKDTPEVDAARQKFATERYLRVVREAESKTLLSKFAAYVENPGDPKTVVEQVELVVPRDCIVFRADRSFNEGYVEPDNDPDQTRIFGILVPALAAPTGWLLSLSIAESSNPEGFSECFHE